MASLSERDDLAVIRIEGMHCHKCQETIQKALKRLPGVHEVEVDFPSAQASVLFDPAKVAVSDLMQAVTLAGYRPTGFVRNDAHNPN